MLHSQLMITEKKNYTRKDIIENIGLAPRLIQFYVDAGVVSPSINDAAGRGVAKQYSSGDMKAFGILKRLSDCGVTLPKIKIIFAALRLEASEKGGPLWNYIEREEASYLITTVKEGSINAVIAQLQDGRAIAEYVGGLRMKIQHKQGSHSLKVFGWMDDADAFIAVDLQRIYEEM